MAGVDTIFRLIGVVLAFVVITVVGIIGYNVIDPVYNNVLDPGLMTDLGWGAPQDVLMLFGTLVIIGLILVVIVWWIVAPVRDDVRQEQRRPF